MADPSPVALVTGGSSGLGRAVAVLLAAEGYRVAVLCRRPERAAGLPAMVVACDVADRASVDRSVAAVIDDLGRLDAVVNSAGILRRGRIESLDDAETATQIAINLQGPLHVARAALPALRATRGAIVNIGSTIAGRPPAGVAVYAATKGATEALTRAMAIELSPDGIRVNAVLPGLVRSDIWLEAGMPAADYERLLAVRGADYPLGRVGEPEDVAHAVAFLLSPKAGWITGVCMPVDGGMSAGNRPAR